MHMICEFFQVFFWKKYLTSWENVRCFEVIHKAAEHNIAARINSDKLTETNS